MIQMRMRDEYVCGVGGTKRTCKQLGESGADKYRQQKVGTSGEQRRRQCLMGSRMHAAGEDMGKAGPRASWA